MQTFTTISEIRGAIAAWREQGERIAFIPTLGNLHFGHLTLISEAKQRAKRVVVSIFINPLQFGANEDFANYPRTFREDSRKLAETGVDALFAPSEQEMYPHGQHGAFIDVPTLSNILCGAHRPGHFRGVATVVAKLFNIIQPQVALFGEKDYQQLQIVRRMTTDLNMPVEIVGVPTVREPDGLAMSSRNAYLNTDERRRAAALYQALRHARTRIEQGHAVAEVEAEGLAALRAAGFQPDYFQVCRADDLRPAGQGDKDLIILAAAWLGRARLIDNVRASLKIGP
ncbi:MAG: pantoate--beta-alanine ligase [Pseudomonadota bacterium]